MDDGWIWFCFVALGISVIHLAFPIGLTGEDEEEENPQWKKILSSAVTLIFTDISFAIIRVHVMARQKTFQIGFNFLSKNVMAALYRFCMIFKSMKALYVTDRYTFV